MADADWKKRVGIPINYSSGDDDDDDLRVVYRNKDTIPATDSSTTIDMNQDYVRDSTADELISQYEQYGSTPPRTRIKNKSRDWDNKKKTDGTPPKSGRGRLARCRINRRNTMDCAILNQMFIDDETKKRSQKLLRDSERDEKRSSTTITAAATNYGLRLSGQYNKQSLDERSDSVPACRTLSTILQTVPKLIESCNRYMSVTSRPIGCRASAPPLAFMLKERPKEFDNSGLKSRQSFHETFANLIKLGSTDKQDSKISHEDYTWQTELKDLIWLELQAWHADRTLEQQDKYLYTARQAIPDLLNIILNYKFQPSKINREISTDSGNSSDASPHTIKPPCVQIKNSLTCVQCFSMYCIPCREQQSRALKEVEELLTRLESAEALYPSSSVMGICHPEYRSEKFISRIKTMCLWYNLTKHHRLKLLILGKLLARLQGKSFQWPIKSYQSTDSSSSSTSAQENDDSGRDSIESKTIPIKSETKVKFNVDHSLSSSPDEIDSTVDTSYLSSAADDEPPTGRYMQFNDVLSDIESLTDITFENVNGTTLAYRKYIENVLKSRGLGKSLNFLHQLHNVVLRKTQITLEKPGTNDDSDVDLEMFDDDIPNIDVPLDVEQETELRKYGAWSAEARSIGLPSYAPAFIFLSVIPLEVIHEFLRMRIESRPQKPNPLSLEQLMKELREGLTLAIIHRERFAKHIYTALSDNDVEYDRYMAVLEKFDQTVKQVLRLYLEYVEQWILVAAPVPHRKSAMDKEWVFTKLISPMIAGQHAEAAHRFCTIISKLLQEMGDTLVNRTTKLGMTVVINDASGNKENADDDTRKWQILTICRETQALFTIERENALKILSFARTFCRDIESIDFHRDHTDPDVDTEFVCTDVKDAVAGLQTEILKVRLKLTLIIRNIQEKSSIKNFIELDEVDKLAILTRSREILHQGYKFGFEYHKAIVRLFESNIVGCKSDSCKADLSLGIIKFARMWMEFVTERCERGRGVRPRWAAQGLEFLIAACDPLNTRHLSDAEFEELKSKMDACISHVVGIVSEPENIRKRSSPRSRKLSPAANRAVTPTRSAISPRILAQQDKSYVQQYSMTDGTVCLSPTNNYDTPDMIKKQTSFDNDVSSQITLVVPQLATYSRALRQIRVRDAVNRLDLELETRLRDRKLIGQVKTTNLDTVHIKARSVNFRWHRGIKIGQGRFGKAYTAVNSTTGELMAMKEIPIQPGETRAIKKVAEELKIFEGINHQYLVKYFGVEIHREELLIFMELCPEGTLESLVEMSGGLYEGLTRRFTAQLLSAVGKLHKHGVVHRDIKTANIFLTNGGSSLKLGDFGSAVKIQAHTTLPGELQGYVGTQSYMAPEVFTKTNTDGHGRAADIWSVGCCVIEMSAGKRPWAQFDSNFQIMFKVGMGETPDIPENLSQEGHEFLNLCLQHDPKLRASAIELMQHHFCKVELEDKEDTKDKGVEIRRSFRTIVNKKK